MLDSKFITFKPIAQVDSWDRTEEVPTGSREKLTVIEPETGKHYIFKYPKEDREHQLWSELLASFIAGDLLGWDVQTTTIGQFEGRYGNLLGYVFEPGSKTASQELFTEGWSLCTQVDPDFDVDKGTRHTLPLLLRVCDEVLVPDYGITRTEFLDFWSRALALDMLISNTDRHAENWAIVTGPGGSRMSALYDNGSSLGCGIDQVGLSRAFDEKGQLKKAHLNQQRRNGRHHLRAAEPNKRGGFFEDVSKKFLSIYPDGRHWFESAGAIEITAVCHLMDSISVNSGIEEPYFLSEKRRQHIYNMLNIGVERIKNTLY
ncbi:hypothetical protein ROA7450_01857 [Roseovarius albus]|uniref:HipA-like C-terminal domain-containing protein n=1 Tax=Roseovarius albus TaxID=1247867 RepID=A0A1X6Z557_9RHOB|nr:HipA domain-containing protein [Roseovarius albus]SLN39102.1 hypothetical protein ROA7450_01857 [Roseovarius albus]